MEQKGFKVLIHASAFFAPYLVPIIFFIISEDESVKKTSVQAVLFQLVMGALAFVSFLLIFVLIGIPMIIAVGIMWFVVPIIAIVKTLGDDDYNYPIVGRWYR